MRNLQEAKLKLRNDIYVQEKHINEKKFTGDMLVTYKLALERELKSQKYVNSLIEKGFIYFPE